MAGLQLRRPGYREIVRCPLGTMAVAEKGRYSKPRHYLPGGSNPGDCPPVWLQTKTKGTGSGTLSVFKGANKKGSGNLATALGATLYKKRRLSPGRLSFLHFFLTLKCFMYIMLSMFVLIDDL